MFIIKQNMNNFTKDNFHEIKSEPNWLVTWCIRFVFFSLLGFLVLSFYFVPVLFYTDGSIDGEQLLAFGMIYYPLLIVLSYFVVRFLKRRKRKSVRHIKVNCEGIFMNWLMELKKACALTNSKSHQTSILFMMSLLTQRYVSQGKPPFARGF